MGEIREFRLPDLGEGLEAAELVDWLVGVGDRVALNQPVADVETAKATVSVPSPFAGVVVELGGEVGDEIAVGELLMRVDVAASAGAATSSGGDLASGGDRAPDGDLGVEREADADRGPSEPQLLVGYGAPDTRPSTRRRRAAGAPITGDEVGRVRAKPAVRRLARELGIDLATVAASAEGGIVTASDVRAAAEAVDASGPSGAGASASDGGLRAPSDDHIEPIRGVRRRIVEKMERSRREIPDASCTLDADVTSLVDVRTRLAEEAPRRGTAVGITPLHLVMRAVVAALRRNPTLNARITRPSPGDGHTGDDAGEIAHLSAIHLGFAVDTERGLVVPNVKDATQLSLWELAEAVTDLVQRARIGRLTPEQLTGGTFTVNNYGAFGVDDGDPILNHPEAAILGVGAIRERPWVVDGDVVPRTTARFTLAFDHRVNDGAQAAAFLTDVVHACEDASWLLDE